MPGAPAWKWNVPCAGGVVECPTVLVKAPCRSVSGTQRWCAMYHLTQHLAFLCGCCGTKPGRQIPRNCTPGPALKFAEQRRGHPMLNQPGGVRGNYGLWPCHRGLSVAWRWVGGQAWLQGKLEFGCRGWWYRWRWPQAYGWIPYYFRWNAVHVGLAMRSLSLHADRYSAILCISKERISSTSPEHLWENRRAK